MYGGCLLCPLYPLLHPTISRVTLSRPLMSRIDLVSKNLPANCKSNKNFSCYVKRLSNKYGKNSKNNKFDKILHLERKKVKNGFVKSANFAKIAKITRLFLAMWKEYQYHDVYASFHSFFHKHTATMHKKDCRLQEGVSFCNKRKRKQNFSWPRTHHNNRPEISRIANREKRKWVIRSAHQYMNVSVQYP